MKNILRDIRMKKLIWVILILLLAIPVGLFTYFTAQSYYQTRNMRNLAKQIEKTGWVDYSYNIYSESVTSGYFKGEILSLIHISEPTRPY